MRRFSTLRIIREMQIKTTMGGLCFIPCSKFMRLLSTSTQQGSPGGQCDTTPLGFGPKVKLWSSFHALHRYFYYLHGSTT